MSRSPADVVGRALVATALANVLVGVPPAAAQVDPSNPRPLVLRVVDLVFTVESLDGADRTTETPAGITVVLGADVLFRFNRADLTPRAATTLREVAEQIRAKASGTVRIDGYTDSKGSPSYNLGLSRRRAAAVQRALLQLLGGEFRLVARGHGENSPVAPNIKSNGADNPAGRARNRRVTVTFDK